MFNPDRWSMKWRQFCITLAETLILGLLMLVLTYVFFTRAVEKIYSKEMDKVRTMIMKHARLDLLLWLIVIFLLLNLILSIFVLWETNLRIVRPIGNMLERTNRFIREELRGEAVEYDVSQYTHNEWLQLENGIDILIVSMRDYMLNLGIAQKKATTDALTGLYNRDTLSYEVTSFLQNPEEYRSCCCFFIMDVDHFKLVNDTYGHHEGDEVLKQVAAALKPLFRNKVNGDVVVRLGGDEFVIFCKGLDSIPIVKTKLQGILEQVALIPMPGGEVLTMSIGVVVAAGSFSDVRYEDLYESADAALYSVKHQGRNGYEIKELTS